jgi:hypothetical protein
MVTGQIHNPPLIYNLASDIAESSPLSPDSEEYKAAFDEISLAVAQHQTTHQPFINEIVSSLLI